MTNYTNYSDHSHSFSGMPVYRDRDCPPGKIYAINGAIYTNDLLHQQFINDIIKTDATFTDTPTKEPMSTIDKIKAERREKREREELEAKFETWDAAIGSASEGDIYAFSVDLSNKTYRYATIFVDKRWHLTGQTTCAMATEDFIAWLIEKDADPQDFVFMEPLT